MSDIWGDMFAQPPKTDDFDEYASEESYCECEVCQIKVDRPTTTDASECELKWKYYLNYACCNCFYRDDKEYEQKACQQCKTRRASWGGALTLKMYTGEPEEDALAVLKKIKAEEEAAKIKAKIKAEEAARIKAEKKAAEDALADHYYQNRERYGCTCECPVYGRHIWQEGESCPPYPAPYSCGCGAVEVFGSYSRGADKSEWIQHLESGKCPRAAAQESGST